jgi:predicted phage replisome organizer
MAISKKYFYMRLKEDFFDSEEMVLLETLPDGILYQNILMKMYCRSLKSEGRLMFNNVIPYNAEILAKITRMQVGTVEKALDIFQQMGLIEILDNGAIYMMNIQNFIGESSTEGDRKRDYRSKIESEKKLISQSMDKCPDKCPTKVHHIRDKDILDIYNINIYDDFESEFETIWKAYPRKEGKTNALKAYIKARSDNNKPVSFEQVQQGVERYVKYIKANNTEQRYIKHGSTWFNQHCWDDDYTISDNSSRPEGYEIIKQEPNDDGGITYHYANGIVRVFDEYNMMIDEYKE